MTGDDLQREIDGLVPAYLPGHTFNDALVEFRKRCFDYVKAYCARHGEMDPRNRYADAERVVKLGRLTIIIGSKDVRMITLVDSWRAYAETCGQCDAVSESLVRIGLRILRENAILDELAQA